MDKRQGKEGIAMDFWCQGCQEDFEQHPIIGTNRWIPCFRGFEIVRYEESPSWLFFAVCPKGHRMIRYGTNIKTDPYFHESIKIREIATIHERDLVQPGDARFSKYFPQQAQEISKAKDDYLAKFRKEQEQEWNQDQEIEEKFGFKGTEAMRIAKRHIGSSLD